MSNNATMNIKSISYFALATLFLVAFFFLLPEPDVEKRSGEKKALVAKNKILGFDVSQNFILRNVNLYDGEIFHTNMDVQVTNFKVAQIGENLPNDKMVDEVDAAGKTLIPGLIDAHTHTWGDALEQALNFGVTTELDMFTMPDSANKHQTQRNQIHNFREADLFSSTILATAPGGHGTEYGFEIPVLQSVEEVEPFVVQRIEQGADYIKAVYDHPENPRKHFPSISLEILEALSQSAKKHNKLLVVHVDNLQSAKQAISAGADGIIHSFMDKLADQALVDLMLKNNAFIVPTLLVEASIAGLAPGQETLAYKQFDAFLAKQQRQQLKAQFADFGIPREAFERAMRSVSILSSAGVAVLAGTDAPNPGTTHGASIHSELALLVKAGLTNEQALHSATGAAAKFFDIGGRGNIKEGLLASMVLLEANPLEDISATSKIVAIWKNGNYYLRKTFDPNAKTNPEIGPNLIADFNNLTGELKNISTRIGAGIGQTTDSYAGGKSEVFFEQLDTNGANGQALKVYGEIKPGFMYAWSGLAYLPGKDYSQGADLSKLQSISFNAKNISNAAELTIMLFQEGSFQPISQTIQLDKNFREFEIKFSNFKGVDLTIVNNLSFVVTGSPKKFSFAIDELRFN
ncbi:MAG: amidohydrolase family protein [Kangiellaceae bacterium]|nr:amidohydrolase family protein [Kangiellaceae bacterium]MCW8999112.1 amidohydrolase family protein [Kangiellaceae bacterium]